MKDPRRGADRFRRPGIQRVAQRNGVPFAKTAFMHPMDKRFGGSVWGDRSRRSTLPGVAKTGRSGSISSSQPR